MRMIMIALAVLLAAGSAKAETTCPFGLVNDTAPGDCAAYIDANANAFCDLSELPIDNRELGTDTKAPTVSEEQLKAMTVAEAAALYGITGARYAAALSEFTGAKVAESDVLQVLHDENGLCAGTAGAIALNLKSDPGSFDASAIAATELISGQELKTMKVSEVADVYGISSEAYARALAEDLGVAVRPTDEFQTLHDNNGLAANVAKEIAASLAAGSVADIAEEAVAPAVSARYKLAWITGVLVLLYALTLALVRLKAIGLLLHRRIWNVLLLLSFLASGLLGLLLVIRINWGWTIALPFNMLYWHVETGTAMALISFIHIWERRQSFLGMLKRGERG